MKRILVVTILLFLKASMAHGQEENIDYLSLAGRLVQDGDYSRAKDTLDKVPEEDRETEKFYLVSSLFCTFTKSALLKP